MDDGGIMFRVDGSRALGLGHIARSLNLAEALRTELDPATERQGELPIRFAVRDDAGARSILDDSQFADPATKVTWLPAKEEGFRAFGGLAQDLLPRVIVTDINLTGQVDEYLAALPSEATHVSLHEHNYPLLTGDIVVAPTVCPLAHSPGATPGVTHFTGSDYLLLPPDIVERRNQAPSPCVEPRRGLVAMGGADPSRLTLETLTALRAYNDPRIAWDVVLGPASEYDADELVGTFPGRFRFLAGAKLGRNQFLMLMASTDAVVTNGGTTLYEALALGRPALALPQNEFEAAVIERLTDTGVVISALEPAAGAILTALAELLENPMKRTEIAETGAALIDGEGCRRVARIIAERL